MASWATTTHDADDVAALVPQNTEHGRGNRKVGMGTVDLTVGADAVCRRADWAAAMGGGRNCRRRCTRGTAARAHQDCYRWTGQGTNSFSSQKPVQPAVSAVKSPVDGPGKVVRLCNSTDKSQRERSRFWRAPKCAYDVTLSKESPTKPKSQRRGTRSPSPRPRTASRRCGWSGKLAAAWDNKRTCRYHLH